VSLPILIGGTLVFLSVACLEMYLFFKDYFVAAPARSDWFWGQPLKATLPMITSDYEQVMDKIIITDIHNQSYMYLLFYTQKTADWLASQNKVRNPVVGYSTLGKYEFRKINWDKDQHLPNTLLVGTPAELPDTIPTLFEYANETSGEVLLRVVKTATDVPQE
jgi:hypothetical protein